MYIVYVCVAAIYGVINTYACIAANFWKRKAESNIMGVRGLLVPQWGPGPSAHITLLNLTSLWCITACFTSLFCSVFLHRQSHPRDQHSIHTGKQNSTCYCPCLTSRRQWCIITCYCPCLTSWRQWYIITWMTFLLKHLQLFLLTPSWTDWLSKV